MPQIDLEAEKREIKRRYRNLLRSCRRELTLQDKKQIRQAFDMALEAHKDMRRKTGEPYIYHPIAVAQIVAEEIGLGATSMVCALLHDTVEDTSITLDDIKLAFGERVMKIIDGLTKISGVFEHGSSQQAENFRKMLLTLSDDVRVILIKLADRLHNMRTLDSMSRNKQLKIASETLYLYAPLAHRLGLYTLKTELEDLSIKYTDAENYRMIAQKLKATKAQRSRYIKNFIDPIEKKLKAEGYNFEIKGRPKSIFSILNKMRKQNVPFEEVYDLFAIRVILDTPIEKEKADCWRAYSIVTDHYHPNPNRLRDWISTPKSNGYESLHTTVMGPKGKWVEVQIRSKRMDELSEIGFAAHWKYKEGSNSTDNQGLDAWLAKIRDILENPEANALEFLDDFKLNLYADEVFAFTPKGALIKLPGNASVLDFAFEIHTDLGSRCIGAKVNNKLVPISYRISNGDQVEIITSNKQRPHEDWLAFVVTGKAKSKIRDFIKEQKKSVADDGREMLERKFKNHKIEFSQAHIQKLLQHYHYKTPLDLYHNIASGKLDKSSINLERILFESEKPERIIGKGKKTPSKVAAKAPDSIVIGEDESGEVDYSFAKCCSPIPGDDIFGFITVGEGVKIHRTNCPNAISLNSNYGYRIIKARWLHSEEKKGAAFMAGIRISGIDSVGIISSITDIISKEYQVNMKSISVESHNGAFEGKIKLYIYDTKHLEALMDNIRKANKLLQVQRIEVHEESSVS